jgi:hypothetical protein
MAEPIDLTPQIATNAQGPASASVDGQSVSQHSLQDQIDADKYLASKEASKRPRRGLRFTKIIPPGTV